MRCVANYEIGSEVSVVADDLVLMIADAHGAFKARIKNIPRSEYETPFLLSLHIYFEAPDLESAREIAEERLVDCLNMLAFTTGASFHKHRIRQIVDADPPAITAIRDVRMWSEQIEYHDPQPFLRQEHARSIERLLAHEVPPAVKRALRWYRLGIDAESPDDQYTYFWFALEIIAELNRPTEKVNDKCPHCQSSLFCEQCEKHPTHKPYPKQAIRAMMKVADRDCDDAIIDLLDKTRNSLMHGATLREIESSLPDPHEHVVDILGRILWKALILQFPSELFDGTLEMGMPSTFVHYNANAVAHVRTLVPVDEHGIFDLEFRGISLKLQPSGPPQSALPEAVRMSHDQYDRLIKLSYMKGEHQEFLQRIRSRPQREGDQVEVLVLATDMTIINRALQAEDKGAWQSLFREILKSSTAEDPEGD